MTTTATPPLRLPAALRGPDPAKDEGRGYRFIETPSGVFVGVSFATEETRGGTAPTLESREKELREAFLRGDAHHRVELPVRLDAATPIAWEDYERLERGLDSILSRDAHSVGQCLIAGHAYLGMAARMVRAAQTTADAVRPGSTVSSSERPDETNDAESAAAVSGACPSASEAIRFYCEQTRADDYARAFAIASRRAAHAVVKRMTLGTLIGFRRALRPRQWRLMAIGRIVYENLRHWMRLGALRFPGIEGKIAWRDFAPTPTDLESPGAQRLLRLYFRHALFRKDPILHTDLFLGFCFLVLVHGLVEWYAAALKRLGAPSGASDCDAVSAALGLVETHFVLDPSFGPLFLHHPAIGDTMHHAANRPNFAHTVIQG